MRIVQAQKARISELESLVNELNKAVQDDKAFIAKLDTKCQNLEDIVQRYRQQYQTTRGKLLQKISSIFPCLKLCSGSDYFEGGFAITRNRPPYQWGLFLILMQQRHRKE